MHHIIIKISPIRHEGLRSIGNRYGERISKWLLMGAHSREKITGESRGAIVLYLIPFRYAT